MKKRNPPYAMSIPLIVILGPTSVGKTKVAVELAKRLQGEIVSADSRQVYRGMDIGTDKPTMEERQGIQHHLLDLVNPDESFTLAHYVDLAFQAIEEVHSRGKIPFMVGSAGLYIRAVCQGYYLPKAPPDESLRKLIAERIRVEGTLPLYQELRKIDPEGAKVLEEGNPRRLIRFYEIYKQTGKLPSAFWKMRDERAARLKLFKFGLIRSRDKLHTRIAERVDEQERRGLLQEIKELLAKYPRHLKAFQTHSYQEVFPYLDGAYSFEKAKSMIVLHTFQYARRQWIWFKKEKGVHWEEAEPFGQWETLASRLERTLKTAWDKEEVTHGENAAQSPGLFFKSG